MGASVSRVKTSSKDDVIDMLRNLSQAYRDDQRVALFRDIHNLCATEFQQLEMLRQVTLREQSSVNVFEQIFKVALGTFDVTMKSQIVDLLMLVVKSDGVMPQDLEALVEAGVSRLTLDVFAFAKAFKAPPTLVENVTNLVDTFIEYEGFADQFVNSGGSKILFDQLVAKHPTDIPRQKAMRALQHLAQKPVYLKGMSESGGISALVQALENVDSHEFLINALKILVVLSQSNSKLLSQIMEVPAHLNNIMKLLDMDDEGIISNSMCIIASSMCSERTIQVINQQNGFARIFEVIQSRHSVNNRSVLLYVLMSLSALMVEPENCAYFHEQHGIELLSMLMRPIRLNKGWPPEAIEQAKQMDKKKVGKSIKRQPVATSPRRETRDKKEQEAFYMAGEKESDRFVSNDIIRTSIILLDRFIDGTGEKVFVAQNFVFQYYVPMLESCQNLDLGILSPSVGLDVSMSSIGTMSDHSGVALLLQTPPPTAPQVFEVVQASIQLFAKLCADCPPNCQALPQQIFRDDKAVLLGFMKPTGDSRSMRLALSVIKLLDYMLPDPSPGLRREGSMRGKLDTAHFDGRFATEPLHEVMPVSHTVIIGILASLCSLLDSVDLVNRKYQSTTFQVALLNAVLRLLIKLAKYPEVIPALVRRVPVDSIKRIKAGGPLMEQVRKANCVPRFIALQTSVTLLMNILAAADKVTLDQLFEPGLQDIEQKNLRDTATPDSSHPQSAASHLTSPRLLSAASIGIASEGEFENDHSPNQISSINTQTGRPIRTPRQYPRDQRLRSAGATSGMQHYKTKPQDTLSSVASLKLGSPSRWSEIKRYDGKQVEEGPDDALPTGLLLAIPICADSWLLSEAEVRRIKRNQSIPLIYDQDGSLKKGFLTRSKTVGDLRPTRHWLKLPDPEQQKISEAEQLKKAAATAAQIAKENAKTVKRIKHELNRLGKTYLTEYQEVVMEQDSAWKELIHRFLLGVDRVRQNSRQRDLMQADGLRIWELLFREAKECWLDINRQFWVEKEAIGRNALKSAEASQFKWSVAVARLDKEAIELAIEMSETEHLEWKSLTQQFKVLTALINAQAQGREMFLASEETVRRKLMTQRETWENKVLLRRRLLDVEANEASARLPATRGAMNFLLSTYHLFLVDQRGVKEAKEVKARRGIEDEEESVSLWLQLEFQLIGLQVKEEVRRATDMSILWKKRQGEFKVFFLQAFGLLLEEEETRRLGLEEAHDKFFNDRIWHFALLGLQHNEEAPRKRHDFEARQLLSKLHRRCATEAIVLIQEVEERRRGRKMESWRAEVQMWRHQQQRIQMIGWERQARGVLTKELMTDLKALVARGMLGRALIGMIDLVAAETVARAAHRRTADDAWWWMLQEELLTREYVERSVLERAERRDFVRIGRGLENYLHMCNLDKASQLFDIWRPNDIMLVPFVVPPVKTARRLGREPRNSRLPRMRQTSAFDAPVREVLNPRKIHTSRASLSSSGRTYSAADSHWDVQSASSSSTYRKCAPHTSSSHLSGAPLTAPLPAQPSTLTPRFPEIAAAYLSTSERAPSPYPQSRALSYALQPPAITWGWSPLDRAIIGMDEVEAGVRGTLQLPQRSSSSPAPSSRGRLYASDSLPPVGLYTSQ